MSNAKITPGATPSRRLTMREFVKTKMDLLDNNHTNLTIKKLAVEKDLQHVNEQVTLHEGAVLYLKQIFKEWATYENDTLRLRGAEEHARIEKIKQEEADKEKAKKKRKGKRKRNG